MKLFYTQEEKQKGTQTHQKREKEKICIVKHKKATQNIDFLIFFNQI